MAKPKSYRYVDVESYYPASTAGLHGPIHVRPLPGQEGISTSLHVECSRELVENYEVGTRFRIRATLTDRLGSGDFLYSYFGWPYEVLD